jgi:hypothetical protein
MTMSMRFFEMDIEVLFKLSRVKHSRFYYHLLN